MGQQAAARGRPWGSRQTPMRPAHEVWADPVHAQRRTRDRYAQRRIRCVDRVGWENPRGAGKTLCANIGKGQLRNGNLPQYGCSGCSECTQNCAAAVLALPPRTTVACLAHEKAGCASRPSWATTKKQAHLVAPLAGHRVEIPSICRRWAVAENLSAVANIANIEVGSMG